jgi:putative hemolysin
MLTNSFAILLMLIFVLLSALFSGAETGMYRVSRLRLRLGVERRKAPFRLLATLMRDTQAMLLSILIGNNLANYLATSTVTLLLLHALGGGRTEYIATVITAPVLFIFSELLPKNIFFYRADTLMPAVAPVLLTFHRIFIWSGIVPLLKKLSRLFARLVGSESSARVASRSVGHPQIETLIIHTREEGMLSSTQADILNRLAAISHVGIRTVMTPLSKARSIDINAGRDHLLEAIRDIPYTRVLVTDASPTNVIGFVNVYEALCSGEQFHDLRDFIEPITTLPAETRVVDAINIMRRANLKILLVTKFDRIEGGKALGIVTMKDLAEELLGELSEW